MPLQVLPPKARQQSATNTFARPVSLKRFGAMAQLSLADEMLVRRLKPRTLAAGSSLTEAEAGVWVILDGWCARVRNLPDGRRQIIHLLLPGDSVNLCEGRWAGNELPIVALTPVIAADAEPIRSAIRNNASAHAGLARACEQAMWCEQMYCLNGIVRLGQQNAYERLAHLILEVRDRLAAVDLVNGGGFHLPVTQDIVANALGLSLVHFSRTLRQMRDEGVIALRPGHVDILKPDVLANAASFPHVANVQGC